MQIVKQLAFGEVGGVLFATRQAAQEHSLEVLIASANIVDLKAPEAIRELAQFLAANKAELSNILADRKPRTTKAKAKRAKRSAATPATTTATATQSAEAYDPTNND